MSDESPSFSTFDAPEAAPAHDAKRAEGEAICAEGNRLMLSGSAIGAATLASAVLLGATCPLCVVGVPAIIGFGVVQRIRGELLKRKPEPETS